MGIRRGTKALQGRVIYPLTAQIRLVPDFIIIGAQKCGTTTLYTNLVKHPWIKPALEKEVHFFDAAYSKGLNWYRAHFPSTFYKQYVWQVYRRTLVTGEASPYYIFYPHAPRRIFETLPQVKLIVLLRNPVDRAYSHYQHQIQRGRETLSFEAALEAEPERLAGEAAKILADGGYTSFNHVHFSYLARGIYADQLAAWREYFSPERMLILNSERFFADSPAVLNQVTGFLGLPAWQAAELKKRNRGQYEKMEPAARARLVDYFRPHNQRLYDLLGARFDWDR